MSTTVQNTRDFRTVFKREYQKTHFRQALYTLFAYTDFREILEAGDSVAWDYDADSVADDLGSDDAYTIRAKTTTKETLTISRKPSDSFIIPRSERIQDHLPTQEKWARKAVNNIITKIDGDVLYDLTAGAYQRLDAGDFGGSSGTPLTVTTGNAASVFAKARTALKNQNVIYSRNKMFRNDIQLDQSGDKFPAAAISPELEEALNLAIGFKDTGAGDQILKEGFDETFSKLFKFNTGISTSLPFEFRYTLTATPTNGKALVLGSGTTTIGSGTAVSLNWVTSLGSTVGNVLAEVNGTTSVTNLVNLLNAPFTGVSSKSVPFVKANLSVEQLRILKNVVAVDNEDGSCVITMKGYGKRDVSQTDAAGTIDREAVLQIFGTSKSVGVVMQRQPELLQSAGELITTSATGGVVGRHFVGYTLYGTKVFTSMSKQLVVIPIAASSFTAPATAVN